MLRKLTYNTRGPDLYTTLHRRLDKGAISLEYNDHTPRSSIYHPRITQNTFPPKWTVRHPISSRTGRGVYASPSLILYFVFHSPRLQVLFIALRLCLYHNIYKDDLVAADKTCVALVRSLLSSLVILYSHSIWRYGTHDGNIFRRISLHPCPVSYPLCSKIHVI